LNKIREIAEEEDGNLNSFLINELIYFNYL